MNYSLVLLIAIFLPAAVVHGVRPSSLIVGGFDADIADFPHQLSLRVGGSHSCGATLINTTRALTAAHCVGGVPSDYSLLGGTSDRTDTTCATCVLINVVSITRHPEFVNSGANGYPNDIAVLTFDEIAVNDNLQPIAMPQPGDVPRDEETCLIAGWGKTSGEVPDLPTVLQQANVTILSIPRCMAEWDPSKISPNNICVEAMDVSACGGDSGSSLVCRGDDNQELLLAGIYSWTSTTCSTLYPSVYTRITSYVDWINAV